MGRKISFVFLILIFAPLAAVSLGEKVMSDVHARNIRTYMSFSLPVDPANIRTLVDLDISYALASTLVTWNEDRQLVSGLAESWEPTSEKEVAFKIRPSAKWSDGKPITAQEVVKSLHRAKKAHGDALKSLYDNVTSIEAKESSIVVFKLTGEVGATGIVQKLTEPMYGVVALKPDGSPDVSKTTGPFVVKSASETEIVLQQNEHWISHRENMPKMVSIRRSQSTIGALLNDPWPNLIGSMSLQSDTSAAEIAKAKYQIWRRSLDKVFFLAAGPQATNADGRSLIQFIQKNLDRGVVTRGLNGFNLTDQFFPAGYVLFDPDFKRLESSVVLPEKFKKRAIEILTFEPFMSSVLLENVKAALKAAAGNPPVIRSVPLGDLEKCRVEGKYDLLLAALPVNDPNIDGSVGFFFGLTPSIIPNAGDGQKDFAARVKAARQLTTQTERNAVYRKVLTDAAQSGSIAPIFHYSTMVIAKDGIDLSQVPTTDETVAFAKVQFK